MARRNQTVDALRAFAALWVCLWHFTSGTGVGAHGYLGVTIFFVISGFIVPYSMLRGGYTIAAWPRFMVRRLARLEPPYLASIAIILALGAYDTFRGHPQEWTAAQVAGHMGYANAFLGLPWLNAVYWSLAIELQYYILMGLALPLLLRARTPAARLAGLAIAAALPLLLPGRSNSTILPYLPVFAAGTLTFLVVTNKIRHRIYWVALAVVAGIVWKTFDAGGALATAGTAALIATARIPRIAPIAWLGAISYSLYLLHVPLGYRTSHMLRRLSEGEPSAFLLVVVPLAVSIAGAALLHRFVERPSLRLAARIGYRATPSASPLPASAPREPAL